MTIWSSVTRRIGTEFIDSPEPDIIDLSANDILWDPRRLRLAIEAASVALWSWNVDTDELVLDDGSCALWAVSASDDIRFEDLSAKIHLGDRDRVRAAFNATRAIIRPYEIDFRIMLEKEVRMLSARGQGSDADIVDRIMFGVFLDVTGQTRSKICVPQPAS